MGFDRDGGRRASANSIDACVRSHAAACTACDSPDRRWCSPPLFGMRWLRKAILRAAGIIRLHDEEKIFAKQTKAMGTAGFGFGPAAFDGIAFIATFKAVVIEGLEVVFIVIAVGATGRMLIPASVGAAAAALIVVLLGIVLHRPLARVPENTLKFSVGVLLSAFGVFWIERPSPAMVGRRLGNSRPRRGVLLCLRSRRGLSQASRIR